VYHELRGRNARTQHFLGVHVRPVDEQAAKGCAQPVERQPGVEQRSYSHVARNP